MTMREDYGERRGRYRADGEDQHVGTGRRFFITVAGPDETAYPSDPANVYYVRWQKNVSYEETPGNQSIDTTQTDEYGYVCCLVEGKYLDEGTLGLAFKENGQWWCLDDVLQNRNVWRFDADGNLIFEKYLQPGNPVGIAVDSELNTIVAVNDAEGKLYKLGPTGSEIWSFGLPRLQRCIVDDEGNVYTINAHGDGPFVSRLAKYDPDGVQVWESIHSGNWAVDLDWVWSSDDVGTQFRLLVVGGAFRENEPGAGDDGNLRAYRCDDGTFLNVAAGLPDFASGDHETIRAIAAKVSGPDSADRFPEGLYGGDTYIDVFDRIFSVEDFTVGPSGVFNGFPATFVSRNGDTLAVYSTDIFGIGAGIKNSNGNTLRAAVAGGNVDISTGPGSTVVRDLHGYYATRKCAVAQNLKGVSEGNLLMLSVPPDNTGAITIDWGRSLYLDAKEENPATLNCCAGGSDGSVSCGGQ